MMKSNPVKKYPVIACCGIDCGLCPRYYTDGSSRCPGCAGEGFFEKHPSCPIITCCVKKKNLETCADCADFPCDRMKAWDQGDSFVTHRRSLSNLKDARERGLDAFLQQQRERINLLKELLEKYDDGRSKSFYCLAAAFLPLEDLHKALGDMKGYQQSCDEKKILAKHLRSLFQERADEIGIELVYRK